MDYRHHVARPAVVFIEVPVGGSPAPPNQAKPPRYPHQHRESWRPRTKPPSKAEALRRLLDAINRNDEAARAMLRPNAAGLKAWLRGRAA